jgi:hypothetical protein
MLQSGVIAGLFRAGRLVRPNPQVLLRRFTGTGHAIALENCPEVLPVLEAVLGLWPVVPVATAEPVIRVRRDWRGYHVSSPWLDVPLGAESEVSAVCAAIIEIAKSWLETQSGSLCLHCAAFERAGRLVLVAGTNRSGKSTLAARLGAAGARLFCDDMLPIRPADNFGIALGVPPRLRVPLPASADATFRTHLAERQIAANRRYAYVAPTDLAPHGAAAPIGVIVLLDRRDDGPAGFSPVSRAETLQHLLLRNLHRQTGVADVADRLTAIMSGAECLRLTYADPNEAADLLMAATADVLLPPLDALGVQPPEFGQPLAPIARPRRRRPTREKRTGYRQATGTEIRQLDDQLFVMTPDGESIMHLDFLASAIWRLTSDATTLAEIIDLLTTAFPDIEPDRIASDVSGLLDDMIVQGVLVIAED